MDKENVVHIHNGVLLSREKNDIMKFAGKWMELENVNLSEVTQTQKDKHGRQCLFSHDLVNSKLSTICKYYQKGYCAYGACCTYDHTKSPPAAGEAVGPVPYSLPSLSLPSPHTFPNIITSVMRTHFREPGKQEKKMVVLRDCNLTGLAEDKFLPSTVNNPGGCSELQSSLEIKPHSYLGVIRSGLDYLAASSYCSSKQQLCPYADDRECQIVDACVYLHRDMCEICRLEVLHPFDSEQRKAHEKMCMSTFEHEMGKAFAFQVIFYPSVVFDTVED
ncbi:hypothetical protein STEG23_037078 [Scotinomys teguina]